MQIWQGPDKPTEYRGGNVQNVTIDDTSGTSVFLNTDDAGYLVVVLEEYNRKAETPNSRLTEILQSLRTQLAA